MECYIFLICKQLSFHCRSQALMLCLLTSFPPFSKLKCHEWYQWWTNCRINLWIAESYLVYHFISRVNNYTTTTILFQATTAQILLIGEKMAAELDEKTALQKAEVNFRHFGCLYEILSMNEMHSSFQLLFHNYFYNSYESLESVLFIAKKDSSKFSA